ncbi:uncharacterized protein LOC126747951 [Anthonomus grandis grandis]|uniref:uncharacterized protein LOC126747951 n=1 Tax=Anthonomus grandis grandis TaxID=2921223 RepID=UPI002165EC92|nr:uncharacterized protein LOC126747951 [Anthonomus grandis grandis]
MDRLLYGPSIRSDLIPQWTTRAAGCGRSGYAPENLNKELVVRYCNQILGILMNCLDYHNLGCPNDGQNGRFGKSITSSEYLTSLKNKKKKRSSSNECERETRNESELILESLQSFSKLLNSLPGYKFHPFQVTAAVRIKLLFSQEDPHLRRSSIQLLGDLATSLGQETNLEAFKEQIQGNLITSLLHLCDPDVYVVKACKSTIQKVGPYLDCPKVNRIIQECLGDDTDLMFTDFIREIIKRMLSLQRPGPTSLSKNDRNSGGGRMCRHGSSPLWAQYSVGPDTSVDGSGRFLYLFDQGQCREQTGGFNRKPIGDDFGCPAGPELLGAEDRGMPRRI